MSALRNIDSPIQPIKRFGSKAEPNYSVDNGASKVYDRIMKKQIAVIDTSFWTLGHRADILTYIFRFFTVYFPKAVRGEIMASDPRHPQRVYGYQEMFRLMEEQGLLALRNPARSLSRFHAGEAAALALALEEQYWLLINEQRALGFARQQEIKAVTVPEFIVYLYESEMLSYRSAQDKLDAIAKNTGNRVMQRAREAALILAQSRGEDP